LVIRTLIFTQKIPMSSFANLTDADIKAILAYVDAASAL
jgi:hypothetical protein